MSLVLLATCSDWPHGEPGAPALDAALAARGIRSRWACWDDAGVDWAAADLVAVRATWDYTERPGEFLAWARRLDPARLLNSADVFSWNLDKAYLVGLADLPAVPTVAADSDAELREAVAATLSSYGGAVVKPRTGANGAGVIVVDSPGDPRLGRNLPAELPGLRGATGPWAVQPLVASVRTEGESSVFVVGGRAVSQVDKRPGGEEIRVHEHFGGDSTAVPLRDEAADLAVRAVATASERLGGPLDYARVDLMRLDDGRLAVSELEAIEPGLHLDVLPANAEPFADLVELRLATAPR
ncbi:ATP-grasp domain-containing protein [Nocardioides taihuensis]|uniref:RimK family alpha-L-glutamate ligase n=1 Tax=Nocardioides taihuensis TaxID=1835606 RepID=A0ABW0BEY2_9ACTN